MSRFSSDFYSSLPSVLNAHGALVDRGRIFAKPAPISARDEYKNRYAVCLVHHHFNLNPGEWKISAANRTTLPERIPATNDPLVIPERWMAAGEPFKFKRVISENGIVPPPPPSLFAKFREEGVMVVKAVNDDRLEFIVFCYLDSMPPNNSINQIHQCQETRSSLPDYGVNPPSDINEQFQRKAGRGQSKTDDDYRSDLIDKSDMKNERFSAYYKAQNIVSEEEWEAFLDALRQPLPTTFRVTGSRQTAKTLNKTIQEVHVPSLSDVKFEGQRIPPPVQIPWYPDGLAWQLNVPKKVLRKSPEFKKFHSFLVFETEVGNISRQEGVSMLPPLFLDVEPHHKVMDMCAAPGSKTAQLLESLHANDSVTSTSIPPGLLIANDSDNKRTHLLIHQSSRLPSPAFMVTNLDASNYPTIRITAHRGAQGRKTERLLFDRILCDVPCSGDGTMRKNLGIWKRWQPMDGNGLHSLQVRILQRAMKMLKSDGRIVYSTCSLNPVENEAVVAEALKTNPDFHLVDVSEKLPELKRRPGMTKWQPTIDRTASTFFETYGEYRSSSAFKTSSKLSEGHWPPADVETLSLDRCLRIYPHLQDSGGFFVAVLEKDSLRPLARDRKRGPTSENVEAPETKKVRLADNAVNEQEQVGDDIPGNNRIDEETEPALDPSETSGSTEEEKPKSADATFKEHPYTFLSPDDPILLNCIERMKLTAEFPSSNILVRNPTGDAVRSMYLTNDLVKAVIENNDYTRIRLTSAGTKVFTKQEGGKGSGAVFRILGEGLPVVLPYVNSATILNGDLSALKILVKDYYPLCSTFNEPFRSVAEARTLGSHVVRFPSGDVEGATLTHELVLPIWKSNTSMTLMMDKKAKSALSMRVFGSDITTAGREAAKQKSSTEGIPEADTNTTLDIRD